MEWEQYDAVVLCKSSFAMLLWANHDPCLGVGDGDSYGGVGSKI